MVAALEQAWEAIRARHPEVPQVVVILGAGSIGVRRGELRLGHFAAMRWHHAVKPASTPDDGPASTSAGPLPEVFVGGEGITRGPGPVLATLLHEAAHALAAVRGIKDVSRQGRWHNERFATLAREVGISVVKDPRIGWSPTTLTDAAADDYAETIDLLARTLPLHRSLESGGIWNPGADGADGAAGAAGAGDPGEGGDNDQATPKKGPVAALCHCPRRIRVTRSVLDAGPILCGVCRTPFRADPGPDEPDPGPGEDDDDPDLHDPDRLYGPGDLHDPGGSGEPDS